MIFLQRESPQFGEKAGSGDSDARIYYSSVKYMDQEYNIGDCAYLDPESYSFSTKPPAEKKKYSRKADVSKV